MVNILNDISNNILYDFLDIYCIKEDNYYILNKSIFKQYEYNNVITEFFTILKKYYYDKSLYYLNREINYNFNRLESNSFLKIVINSSTVQFLKESGKELGSNDCNLWIFFPINILTKLGIFASNFSLM